MQGHSQTLSQGNNKRRKDNSFANKLLKKDYNYLGLKFYLSSDRRL